MNYLEFLDKKPLFYEKIDYDRMPNAYKKIKNSLIVPPIIHIVGTNGKGTTGRFMAKALLADDLNVGHYTSPHILAFNERIWLNGSDAENIVLERAHKLIFSLLGKKLSDTLSYFEYTTFMAMAVFQNCDIVILEAGLGGEYDATNVFEKKLSVFTPIDFDHQAFLGDSIEKIASTKLRSMANLAVLAEQPHKESELIFDSIAKERGSKNYYIKDLIDDDVKAIVNIVAEAENLPYYLIENLKLALSSLKLLGLPYTLKSSNTNLMFGRLTKLNKHIYLDVGHNVLAAKAIATSLKGQKFTLIYNSYKDKEIADILKVLKPIIESVEIIEVDSVRVEQLDHLENILDNLSISHRDFREIEKNKKYLVFGSFSVAEAFLKYFYE